MPILFVGDIHLGRRPAGLDVALSSVGLNAHQLSSAAAWRETVKHAVEIGARAVVLAGDVVDSEKDRFEAYTPVAKRALGYYALPLLWRDQAIGWGNATVTGGRLDVQIGYVTGRAPRDRAYRSALDAELSRLRLFLG